MIQDRCSLSAALSSVLLTLACWWDLSEGHRTTSPAVSARLVPMPSRSCPPEPTVALGGDRRNGADRLGVNFTGLSVALALVPHAFRTGTLTESAPHGSQSLNIDAAVWTDRRCCSGI